MLGKCTECKTTEGVLKPIHVLTFEVKLTSLQFFWLRFLVITDYLFVYKSCSFVRCLKKNELLRIFTSKISFWRRRSYAKQAILRHYALANQRFLRSVPGSGNTTDHYRGNENFEMARYDLSLARRVQRAYAEDDPV